ncbi:MAG: DUF4102 domain-containing protein, partial [Desulfovibrio sp.]|nr:DUF4102 domain-containing protein [Desulfovibrio sp.]
MTFRPGHVSEGIPEQQKIPAQQVSLQVSSSGQEGSIPDGRIEEAEQADRRGPEAEGQALQRDRRRGLRILVYPKDANGRERSKRWESKVSLNGREIRFALGTWPGASLDWARELHAQYRAEAEARCDPRDLKKPAPESEAEQTFAPPFWDWFGAKSPGCK